MAATETHNLHGTLLAVAADILSRIRLMVEYDPGVRQGKVGLRMRSSTRTFHLLAVAGILAAGAALLLAFDGSGHLCTFIVHKEEWFRRPGTISAVAGAVGFIAMYAGLMMLLVIPAWICSITAGFLFGLRLGGIVALSGATLGATGVFLMARGRLAWLAERAGPFVHRFERKLRRNAFTTVLIARVIPVIPFTAVNVIPAMSGVRLAPYVLATVIGILPSTALFIELGNAVGTSALCRAPSLALFLQPKIPLPILGLVVLALLPVVFRRWREPPE